MSDSLRPRESQHARPPCPSPTPGVHSNSCPSSQWCHPATSSSVVPFSSCPKSLPASESFPMSQLFAWGGQSTGVSALASVLPNYLRKLFSVLYLILVYSAYHVTHIYHCLGKYILIYCHWWKFYLEGNCSLGIFWIPQSSEEWHPN